LKRFDAIGFIIITLVAFYIFQFNGCKSPPVPQNKLSVYFTGQNDDPERVLINLYNSVPQRGYVYVAIYAFDSGEIYYALKDAKEKGVDVRIIADISQTKNSQKNLLDRLKSIDIPIKVNIDPYKNMHMKVSIINDRYVTTGSYNYTNYSKNNNTENLLVIPSGVDKKAVLIYKRVFLEMWDDSEKYRPY